MLLWETVINIGSAAKKKMVALPFRPAALPDRQNLTVSL
jgi:hypothetical protein